MKTTTAFPTVQEVAKIDVLSDPFFHPDDEFVKWLIAYANGRVICDVGAGSGWLCALIIKNGGKAFGVEPRWTMERANFWHNAGFDFNIIPQEAERSLIIRLPAEKTMYVFARPCHNGFVERTLNALPAGAEAIYISGQENFLTDLGKYLHKAKRLAHKGTSKEGEIVSSVKL